MPYTGVRKSLLLLMMLLSVCAPRAQEGRRRVQTKPGATAASEAGARGQGRLRPREDLGCDINDTTSFTGRVLSYSRSRSGLFLRVRTDEETTEEFTISLKNKSGAEGVFLFKGEPFKSSDWKKIERRAGVLKQGMRATVWACYVAGEPRAKLIDWQPRETDTGSVY